MNRRQFLRAAGIAAAVTAMPSIAPEESALAVVPEPAIPAYPVWMQNTRYTICDPSDLPGYQYVVLPEDCGRPDPEVFSELMGSRSGSRMFRSKTATSKHGPIQIG